MQRCGLLSNHELFNLLQGYFVQVVDCRPEEEFQAHRLKNSFHWAEWSENVASVRSQTTVIFCGVKDKGQRQQLLRHVLKLMPVDVKLRFRCSPLRLFVQFIDDNPFLCVSDTDSPQERPVSSQRLRYPSEILPRRLYLGSAGHAKNREIIKSLRISHVVNVSRDVPCYFEQGLSTSALIPVRIPVLYKRIPIGEGSGLGQDLDEDGAILRESLRDVVEFMSGAISKGHRVLVHCKHGMSGSAATVMAYLMATQLWDHDKARKFVMNCRPSVRVGEIFLKELQVLELDILAAMLNEETTSGSSSSTTGSDHGSTSQTGSDNAAFMSLDDSSSSSARSSTSTSASASAEDEMPKARKPRWKKMKKLLRR